MGMPPPPPPAADGSPSNPPGWGSQPPPPPPGLPEAPVGTVPNYPPAYYQPLGVGGERAGFGSRLGAWLLDGLLYGLLALVFLVPAFAVGAGAFADCDWVETEPNSWEVVCPPGEPDGGLLAGAVAIGILGWLFVAFLYVRAMGKTGQTWGAKIVGVRVVDQQTGNPIGFWRALGRSLFANIISANVFYLGYLWMLWDDRKQTWQDKVVNSVVLRT